MLSSYLELLSWIYGIPIYPKWLTDLKVAFNAVLGGKKINNETEVNELDETIEFTGYAYDPNQDIYYSVIDPWQRKYGYCHLYDELSAPWGMIMDCEPMFFDYGNKRWMVSVWKGQYDLTTGCEIGIYEKNKGDFKLMELLTGNFFNSPPDEDMLQMSFTLKKNGKVMFTREEKHWWLTGFKLGEYTEPHELTMDVNITFKDKGMANAYVVALKKAGYLDKEINLEGSTVSFFFDKPRTTQPMTREKYFEAIIQWKNKLMCDKYQEITKGYSDVNDKLNALKEQAPELYDKILHIRKLKKSFDFLETLDKYLF